MPEILKTTTYKFSTSRGYWLWHWVYNNYQGNVYVWVTSLVVLRNYYWHVHDHVKFLSLAIITNSLLHLLSQLHLQQSVSWLIRDIMIISYQLAIIILMASLHKWWVAVSTREDSKPQGEQVDPANHQPLQLLEQCSTSFSLHIHGHSNKNKSCLICETNNTSYYARVVCDIL